MIFAEAVFDQDIKGTVSFSQINEVDVRVDIYLENVPNGIHGIHVHEKPVNCLKTDDCCSAAKGHFNGNLVKFSRTKQRGTPHGSWRLQTERHIGDLCNNVESINGIVNFSYIDNLISLIPGHPHNIIGRSVILHEDPDDEGLMLHKLEHDANTFPVELNKEMFDKIYESLITGNAGKRIACANIFKI